MNVLTRNDTIHRELGILREQVEAIEAENKRLRMLLRPETYLFLSPDWNLKRNELQVLLYLYTGPDGRRSTEDLITLLDSNNKSNATIVKARVSTLRKKVQPKGIEIETIWCFGYRLTKESIAILKLELAVTPRYALGLPPFDRSAL